MSHCIATCINSKWTFKKIIRFGYSLPGLCIPYQELLKFWINSVFGSCFRSGWYQRGDCRLWLVEFGCHPVWTPNWHGESKPLLLRCSQWCVGVLAPSSITLSVLAPVLCACVCEYVAFVGQHYVPVWSASWLWPLTLVPGDYQGRQCDFPSSICRAIGSTLTGRPSLAPGTALGSNVPIWGRGGRWRPGQLSRCRTTRTRLRDVLLGGSLLCSAHKSRLIRTLHTWRTKIHSSITATASTGAESPLIILITFISIKFE